MRFDRREFWGVCLTGVGIGCSRFSAERSEPEEFRLRSAEPLCIFWESPKSEFSSRQRAAIQRVVALPEPSLNYDRLHWLRFVGPLLRKSNETLLDELVGESEIVKLRSIREKLLRQLLHSDDYQTTFGTRLHVLTRHGIGFVTADSQEVRQTQFSDPHPNKILSLLGLSGITTDHEVVVDGYSGSVADCVRFACRNCGLNAELPWTTIALCQYLPPTTSWRDKTDARITFDDIATRLCGLRVGDGSCFGHHVCHALITLRQLTRQYPQLLSSRTIQEVESWLRNACEIAATTQSRDGSWNGDWAGTHTKSDAQAFRMRLLSTSHCLEWMSCVPKEICDTKFTTRLASDWLSQIVLNATEHTLLHNFSAVSHAAFGLVSHACQGGCHES
jgi:hypothetical protein